MKKKILKFAFWIIWFGVVFYGVSFGTLVMASLIFGADRLSDMVNDAIFGSIFTSIVFSLMVLLVWFVPNKFFSRKISLKTAGFDDYPTWSDIALGVIGFFVAMFLASGLTILLQPILGFDPNQKQNIGFLDIRQSYQYILAFVSLVVITPIAEEFIFRGVIYGELRQVSPFWAAIVVSLMFGVAHGQVNVGIVTFAMSLVMCFMREKITGTIWSSIFLHMIKNGLAFYLIFIAPNLIYGI